MNDSKRVYVITAIAALFMFTIMGVAGMWIYAERAIAQDWRAEAQRQQALADTMTQELNAHARALEDLRNESMRQRAAAETLAAELRGEAAAQRAVVQNIQDQFGARRITRNIDNMDMAPRRVVRPRLVEPPMPNIEPQPLVGRGWGPEQATGEPNTPAAGDMQTAWASRTPDGQQEWLILDYAQAVKIARIKVHETYNTGALTKISVFDEAVKEIEVWQGRDPTPVGAGMGISEVPLAAPQISKRIKIYLDSPAVPGWNEIDAVGIVSDVGVTQYATQCRASSTYAEQNEGPLPPAARNEQIDLLNF
jgi:hypothetical protein